MSVWGPHTHTASCNPLPPWVGAIHSIHFYNRTFLKRLTCHETKSDPSSIWVNSYLQDIWVDLYGQYVPEKLEANQLLHTNHFHTTLLCKTTSISLHLIDNQQYAPQRACRSAASIHVNIPLTLSLWSLDFTPPVEWFKLKQLKPHKTSSAHSLKCQWNSWRKIYT